MVVSRRSVACESNRRRRNVVTHYERQIGFRDGFLPAHPARPALSTLKTAALLAALLAYGIGFAILYPLAEASVSKSDGPALMDFVAP
jgi:hypothetical protein